MTLINLIVGLLLGFIPAYTAAVKSQIAIAAISLISCTIVQLSVGQFWFTFAVMTLFLMLAVKVRPK